MMPAADYYAIIFYAIAYFFRHAPIIAFSSLFDVIFFFLFSCFSLYLMLILMRCFV